MREPSQAADERCGSVALRNRSRSPHVPNGGRVRLPENEKRRSGEQKAYHSRFAETANVLNKLPKSQQSKAKRALQEIRMAETKKDALKPGASNTTRLSSA